MRRLLVLLACSVILWAIVTQLNHTLTDLRLFLFIGGLFVTFGALTQPFVTGLWCAMLTGLVFDANTPVAFGTHLVLFAAAHIAIFQLRDRIPRNDTISRVTVAVLANLALFLVFSFIQIVRTPIVSAVWPRMLMDLFCSQVFLAIIAPWFFALQERALVLARVERELLAG